MEQDFKLASGNVCRTQIEHKIYQIIAKTLHSLGYFIVKMRLFRSGEKSTLQVCLEKNDGKAVNISDCEKASKCISAILDVKEDLIEESYHLEVMSTGVNRPLTRSEDFSSNIGNNVRIKTLRKIDTSSVYNGRLVKASENNIVLDCGDGLVAIELNNIGDASLQVNFDPPQRKEDKKSPQYKQKFEDKQKSNRKAKKKFSSSF